jgi:hypothetical protein
VCAGARGAIGSHASVPILSGNGQAHILVSMAEHSVRVSTGGKGKGVRIRTTTKKKRGKSYTQNKPNPSRTATPLNSPSSCVSEEGAHRPLLDLEHTRLTTARRNINLSLVNQVRGQNVLDCRREEKGHCTFGSKARNRSYQGGKHNASGKHVWEVSLWKQRRRGGRNLATQNLA